MIGRGWALLATLGALVVVSFPELGSQPWPFRGEVVARGPLAFVVRASHERWDLGVMRSIAVLAGVLVAVCAVAYWSEQRRRPRAAVALAAVVAAALVLPATLLQLGLRDSTAPWRYVNDSTYQIELAGGLVRHGHNPYTRDYSGSGLERWYAQPATRGTEIPRGRVALRHFAYFPGTALLAAAWDVLPGPFDDYRLLVALCTLGLLGAALVFPGPLEWRLALGAVLAANPLSIRAAWFGTADAPDLLLLVLAFALLARRRFTAAAACLGGAVLVKQFAIVAVPFFAAMLRQLRAPWRVPLAAGAGVLLAGLLPFLVAGPGELWSDTITYGGGTYRIVGYGLAALLLRAHALSSRTGYYPFFPLAALVWLPVTAWLVRLQLRSREPASGAVGFAVSIFLLLFLGRVFQTSYLIYPLVGMTLALLLSAGAAHEDERAGAVPAHGHDEPVAAGRPRGA
jgi:glycosyl transferase family 87